MKKILTIIGLLSVSFAAFAADSISEERDKTCVEFAVKLATSWGSLTGFQNDVSSTQANILTHQGRLNGVSQLIVIDVDLVDGIKQQRHAKVFLNSTCQARGIAY